MQSGRLENVHERQTTFNLALTQWEAVPRHDEWSMFPTDQPSERQQGKLDRKCTASTKTGRGDDMVEKVLTKLHISV